MKRMLSLLLAMFILSGTALAELSISLFTPTPSPAPAGTPFSCESFRLTLPHGLEVLDGEALSGYEAALQADYPGAGQTLMAAADETRAVFFAAMESEQSALAAAQEAAQALLGSPAAAEISFGPNLCAHFACALGDHSFQLYYFSNGSELVIAALSGLTPEETAAMLGSLELHERSAAPSETPQG